MQLHEPMLSAENAPAAEQASHRSRGRRLLSWWGWVALALWLATVVYLVASLLVAQIQRETDRVLLPPDGSVEIELRADAERVIYLPPEASGPYAFDFYASDFRCSAVTADGEAAVVETTFGEGRFLDGWSEFDSVATVRSTSPGVYTLSCAGKEESGLRLVVAAPSSLRTSWADPLGGILVAVAATVVLGPVVAFSFVRQRRRTAAPS